MPLHEFTHLPVKPGISFVVQTLFSLVLSANQKQIKPHLLSTVDAQGLGLDCLMLIRKLLLSFS